MSIELPVLFWVGGLTGVDSGLTLPFGMMKHLWFQFQLGGDQGVISVTVGTVEGPGVANVVQGVALGNDHVQLMPVF